MDQFSLLRGRIEYLGYSRWIYVSNVCQEEYHTPTAPNVSGLEGIHAKRDADGRILGRTVFKEQAPSVLGKGKWSVHSRGYNPHSLTLSNLSSNYSYALQKKYEIAPLPVNVARCEPPSVLEVKATTTSSATRKPETKGTLANRQSSGSARIGKD